MSRRFRLSPLDDHATYFLSSPSAAYDNLRAFTVSAWVFPKSTGTNDVGYVIVKDPDVTDSIISDFNDAGRHWFGGAGTTGEAITNEAVPLDRWTHITVSCDYNTDALVRVYFNGVEQTYSTQTAASPVVDDSSQGFSIGNFPLPDTDYGWDGRIAEVAVWNSKLSQTDITALAASRVGAGTVASANLVAYWPLRGLHLPEPDVTTNGNHMVASPNPPTIDVTSPGRAWETLAEDTRVFNAAVDEFIR